jgi:hypothetical protein
MKADLTRRTFEPLKHFSRVLMQQGRVQLDADWNEQIAITLHHLRALGADLIGSHGGPNDNLGFTVHQLSTGSGSPPAPVTNDFIIGYGHYYVDGILCEVDSRLIPITGFFSDETNKVKVLYWPQADLAFRENQYVEISNETSLPPVRAKVTRLDPEGRAMALDTDVSSFSNLDNHPRVRHLTTYLTQPDYPVPSDQQLKSGDYLLYLDVWERLVTYVEDDTIREVALDGPDTTARSQIVCQVKVQQGTAGEAGTGSPCDNFNPSFATITSEIGRGWLKATARQETTSTDPCIVSPSAQYRGAENQLYRVEIHRPGSAWDGKDSTRANAATFKWSRENGSAIYSIVSLGSGGGKTTATLENLGRDDRFGLVEGDWVEVVDDNYVLQNRAEPLLRVHAIDRTSMTVTLDGALQSNVGQDPAKHPILRRWDQKEGDPSEGGLQLSDGAALIIEDEWLEVEDGIKIQFQKPDDKQPPNSYRTADYWLIPARTATGDVEWPREKDRGGNLVPIAKPPDGIEHHYAPLAVISVDAKGLVDVKQPSCQKSFKHITEFP